MSSACDLVLRLTTVLCLSKQLYARFHISEKRGTEETGALAGPARLLGSSTKELGMGVSWDKGVRVTANRAKPLLMTLARARSEQRA